MLAYAREGEVVVVTKLDSWRKDRALLGHTGTPTEQRRRAARAQHARD
jgi:hypothetical protein